MFYNYILHIYQINHVQSSQLFTLLKKHLGLERLKFSKKFS